MLLLKEKTLRRALYVMSAILCFFTFAKPVFAQVLPEASSDFYVYDPSGTLSQETKDFIMSVNEQYGLTEEKPQVVVAVVDSLQGETIEQYSVDLFEKWRIGNGALDNGVLILLALKEREVRFEVGYGLEGALTDSRTGKILDNNLSYLSANDFDNGLKGIFTETAYVVNEEYHYDNDVIFSGYPVDVNQYESQNGSTFLSLIFRIVLFLIILSFFVGGRGGRGGRGGVA